MDPVRRQVLGWGALSLLLLPVAFLLSPPASPPLYDGLGFPEDPYVFFGVEGPDPRAAELAVTVTPSGSPQSYLATPERGPQAALVLLAGAVVPDSGSRAVTVRVEPVAPPGPVRDGQLLSNAYRVELVGGALSGPEAVVVQLRVPDETDESVAIELHDGREWRTLKTRRIGAHVHSAFLPAEGTVAAVQIRDARRSLAYGESTRGGSYALPLVAGAIALLGAAVLVVRARRTA